MFWTAEAREVTEMLADTYVTCGHGCEEACAHCPFAEACAEAEAWYGCPAWEDGMGEDL